MRSGILILLVGAALVTAPVSAEPPAWAKGGKNKHEGKHSRHHRGEAHAERSGRHFSEHHHVAVREYYGEQFRRGKCPPGLAKKNNGCMPPGQAKKWRVGAPLPREVVYYDVPPALVIKLGKPQVGHRYVRVAADILLIAVGTGMVIDAIGDLAKL
jgi:Ni/Co efflux regulator RcnB